MRIQINNEVKIIPSSLREITLKQRIDFQTQHGILLQDMHKSIMEMEDSDDREIELAEWRMLNIIHGVSFFTDIPIEDLKQSSSLNQLVSIYTSSLATVFEEEQKIMENIEYEHTWNNELWYIKPPELKQGSELTFGEFIDSKQVIQNLVKLGKSRIECLIPLCAIYLRRKDEPYEESYLYENSERLKLMENLPMDIALNVGFFLTSSLSMFIATSQSFINPGQNLQVDIQKSTLKTSDG